MDLFWCISMTNNVESCKKINGRVQTFRFSVFTMGRQELCAENAKKTPKLEKLKRKLLKFLKRYDLYRVVPWESWRPEVSENVVVFEFWRFYLGPPQAHGDPAPLGPKERKLKREELVFYQFIQAAGQKVSPLTGSWDVGAMTVFMLLTLVSQSGPIRHRTFTFCRHAYKNFPQNCPNNRSLLFSTRGSQEIAKNWFFS